MNQLLFLPALVWLCSVGLDLQAANGFAGSQDYVSLRDWADRSRFEMVWLRKDEEVRLTNRTATLCFKVNSQRAEINGISVFLSFPIALLRGEAHIASKDARLVLDPILRPKLDRPGQPVRTIALCAGHGGKDPGNHAGPELEKNYTLALAQEVRTLLVKAGIKVVMIRDSDRFIDLEERVRIAKRAKADLYVSLHHNSANAHNVEGSEVYCLTPAGTESTNGGSVRGVIEPGNRNDSRNVLLAYEIQKRLVRHARMEDHGLRRAWFVVLRQAEMPAVLVEAGYMSNPDEMKRIKDSTHRQRTAQAIVDGILGYKRAIEP